MVFKFFKDKFCGVFGSPVVVCKHISEPAVERSPYPVKLFNAYGLGDRPSGYRKQGQLAVELIDAAVFVERRIIVFSYNSASAGHDDNAAFICD